MRELRNVVHHALVLALQADTRRVELEHLAFLDEHRRLDGPDVGPTGPARGVKRLEQVKAEAYERVLREANGNVTAAAKRFGVARSTMQRHLAHQREAAAQPENPDSP